MLDIAMLTILEPFITRTTSLRAFLLDCVVMTVLSGDATSDMVAMGSEVIRRRGAGHLGHRAFAWALAELGLFAGFVGSELRQAAHSVSA